MAFDVLEGDPEAAFAFATVVYTDDGRVPQRDDIGFAFEACAVFGILGQMRGEDFERVVARQPGWRARYTSPIPPAPSSRSMV